MTPEGRVKEKVKKILKEHGAYYFMPVQAGYGMPALDFHCCFRGRAFFIETKAAGKKPTPRQELTMKEIRKAHGVCFVIDGTPETYVHLKKWLKNILKYDEVVDSL